MRRQRSNLCAGIGYEDFVSLLDEEVTTESNSARRVQSAAKLFSQLICARLYRACD